MKLSKTKIAKLTTVSLFAFALIFASCQDSDDNSSQESEKVDENGNTQGNGNSGKENNSNENSGTDNSIVKNGVFIVTEGPTFTELKPADGVFSATFKKSSDLWSECTSIPLVFEGKADTNYKISYKLRTSRDAISVNQPRTIFAEGRTTFKKTLANEWTDVSVYSGTYAEGFSMLRFEIAMETTEESVKVDIKDIKVSETTEAASNLNFWKANELLTENDISASGTNEEFTLKFKTACAAKWQQEVKFFHFPAEKGNLYKVSYTVNAKNATNMFTTALNINEYIEAPEYSWTWSEASLEANVDTEVMAFVYMNKDADYYSRIENFAEYEKNDLNKNPFINIGICDSISNEISVKNISAQKISFAEMQKTMAIMWASESVENETSSEYYVRQFDGENKFKISIPAGKSVYGRPMLTKLSMALTNPWDTSVHDNALIHNTNYLCWDLESPENIAIEMYGTDKLKITNNGFADLDLTAIITEEGKLHFETKDSEYTVDDSESNSLNVFGISGFGWKNLHKDTLFLYGFPGTEGDYFALESVDGTSYYYPAGTITIPNQIGVESEKVYFTRSSQKRADVSNLDSIKTGEIYYAKIYKEENGTLSVSITKSLSLEPAFTGNSGTVELPEQELADGLALKKIAVDPGKQYRLKLSYEGERISKDYTCELDITLRGDARVSFEPNSTISHVRLDGNEETFTRDIDKIINSGSNSYIFICAEGHNAKATVSDISLEEVEKQTLSLENYRVEWIYSGGSARLTEGHFSENQVSCTFTYTSAWKSYNVSKFIFWHKDLEYLSPVFGDVSITVGEEPVLLKKCTFTESILVTENTSNFAEVKGMEAGKTYKIIITLENAEEDILSAQVVEIE